MLIKSRPAKLTNAERNIEKTRLVLEQLHEWGVSNLEMLAARIGLKPNGATRFFKKLLDQRLIERLNHATCNKRDLVVLGPAAANFLEGETRDFTSEIMRGRRLKRKQLIQHDLEAQKAVLSMMPHIIEVISEYNWPGKGKRPDAVVFGPKGGKAAVELEFTRKGDNSIYFLLHQYVELLGKDEFESVYFFFSFEEDKKYYEDLFNEELWPKVHLIVKKRVTKATGDLMKIGADHPLRKRFFFRSLPLKDAPRLFKMEEAVKPKPFYEKGYIQRIEENWLERLREIEKEKRDRLDEIERKREQENQHRAEVEAAREEKLRAERSETVKQLRLQIEESEKADKSLSSWIPGYQSKTESLKKELSEYLAS